MPRGSAPIVPRGSAFRICLWQIHGSRRRAGARVQIGTNRRLIRLKKCKISDVIRLKKCINLRLFARKSVILSLKNKVVPCLKGK